MTAATAARVAATHVLALGVASFGRLRRFGRMGIRELLKELRERIQGAASTPAPSTIVTAVCWWTSELMNWNVQRH